MHKTNVNTSKQQTTQASSLRGFFIGGVPCGSRHNKKYFPQFTAAFYKHWLTLKTNCRNSDYQNDSFTSSKKTCKSYLRKTCNPYPYSSSKNFGYM